MPVRRVALRTGLVLAGAVICVASVAVSRHVWSPSDVPIPWGLVLCLGTTFSTVHAAGVLDGPGGAVSAAIGWAAVLVYLFGGRPEGDYLFASDWLGYAVLIGGLFAVGAGVIVSMTGPRTVSRVSRPTI